MSRSDGPRGWNVKLQLALDRVDLSGVMAVLQEVGDLVDIVEIGTPVIIREGARAVAETKRAFPKKEVLADLKIMDAGEYEASIAFDAGADIVTVLGAAHDATVLGAIREARARSRRVMVDMIAVEDVPARVRQVDDMGADFVCVHTATDVQWGAHDPLRNLADVAPLLDRAALAVAGGIEPGSLPRIMAYRPAIVVVGSYITQNPDRRGAALGIRRLLR